MDGPRTLAAVAAPDTGIDAASLLARTELFATLPAAERERLARRAVLRRHRRGDVIITEGGPGDALFVVVEGSVRVFVTSAEGAEMALTTLTAGDTLGELAVIDGGPRSASAQALEPSLLLVLGRDELLATLREHPPIAEALLRALGGLVRRLTDQAADLVFLDLQRRLAKLLCTMSEAGRGETGVRDIRLTQAELASAAGGSRQSINQILRSLEEAGIIEIASRRLRVLRPDLLRERAGLD